MPYKDYKRKLKHGETWRKEKHTPEYMKWLYAKRMVPRRQAEIMRQALEQLASGENLSQTRRQEIAYGALEWCKQHEQAVGNRYNHDTETPYYQPPGPSQ